MVLLEVCMIGLNNLSNIADIGGYFATSVWNSGVGSPSTHEDMDRIDRIKNIFTDLKVLEKKPETLIKIKEMEGNFLKLIFTSSGEQLKKLEQAAIDYFKRFQNPPVQEDSLKKRALRLEETLSQRIIGQPKAIQVVSDAVCCRLAELSDPNQPIGRFLFVGPTGVGKTEMAKALASEFYRNSALLSINVPEYTHEGDMTRLIGSAPGYVGSKDGGLLTNFVQNNPYSVILVDEVEKGTAAILDLFLKILDEGSIQDAQGKTADFKNTIIIFTSNIGAAENKIQESIKKYFRPEFLGRLDGVVTFSAISKEMNDEIVNLELAKIEERGNQKGMHFEFSSKLREFLYDKTFQEANKLGAREIKKTISEYVVVPLSRAIISSDTLRDYVLDLEGGKLQILSGDPFLEQIV